jgi:peptidoglycan/LPS O-acetylase OafA/YrhL
MTTTLTPTSTPSGYFPALTGIRAISAFLVYIHHYQPFPEAWVGSNIFAILKETHIGVSVFFVLSGFLIAYRYYGQISFSFRKYFINRIARIYPVYFLLTIVTFIFIPNAFIGSYSILLLNLSFLRGFFREYLFTGIAQGWSLSVEETFYFIAPFFFSLIRKTRWFLLFLPIICLVIGYVLVQIFADRSFHGFFGSNSFMLLYTFFGRSIEFVTGISLALFYLNNPIKFKSVRFTSLGSIMIILCLAALASFSSPAYKYGVLHPFGIWINNFILPVFAISILFYGFLSETTWFSRFLSTPFMELLGKSSFIFYLIHMGVISDALLSVSSNLIFHFIALNLISILLFKKFEEPVNHLIRRKFSS